MSLSAALSWLENYLQRDLFPCTRKAWFENDEIWKDVCLPYGTHGNVTAIVLKQYDRVSGSLTETLTELNGVSILDAPVKKIALWQTHSYYANSILTVEYQSGVQSMEADLKLALFAIGSEFYEQRTVESGVQAYKPQCHCWQKSTGTACT